MAEAEMIRVFKAWDNNGDGRISQDELTKVLSSLDPGKWEKEATDPLFKKMGDADGYILYKDFVSWAYGGGKEIVKELGQLVSPHQFASTVIKAPASSVFELVRPLTFKWMRTVSSTSKVDDGTINIAYADDTVQKIQELEFSLLDFEVSWEVLDSDPPAPTFSAVHTIKCHRITTTGECFLAWNTDFSSDCMLPVLEDCKWKKIESFEQLQDFVGPTPLSRTHSVGGGKVVSPHQFSSALVGTSASAVFALVKTLHFKWMRSVSTASIDEDGSTINIAYADDTVQKLHLLELSALDSKVTWEVLESEPAAPTMSAVHTIRCYRVTTSNQCFVTWNTDFSSDVTSEVIEDCRWKKEDSFSQLQDFLCPKAS